MKKSMRKIISLAMGSMMAMSVIGGSGMGLVVGSAAEKRHNPEEDAVVFATDALDGNFNPFFATSGSDTTIAAITQIGMLTTDKDGNPVCGEDQPTVVLDYKETMKKANGQTTTNGGEAATTEYEFIIKNGIRFSDGVELTIKDVLFNLYVYLDPVYMGSATIYSTDIVGLKKYREQNPDATDDGSETSQTSFYVKAEARVQAMLDYLDPDTSAADKVLTEQIEEDIKLTQELFREEVESDWNTHAGTLENYEKEYNFTEDWQVYYLMEGIISIKREKNENGVMAPVKDENGKYLTSLDNPGEPYTEEIENQKNDETKIAAYMEEYDCDRALAQEYIVRDTAIEAVYTTYSDESKLSEVLNYWATGDKVRDKFAAEAKTAFYATKVNDGELDVKTVEGITTSQTDVDYDGNKLSEQHDVLKIVINGVDPKAIWNFAFSVAPMHYYSGKYQPEWSDKVIDYVAEANGVDKFGVAFADEGFFEEVLKATEKNGLPVGAGTYQATNELDKGEVNRKNFYKNNWVYFKRNDYFYTVGSGLHNANIKYMNYRVVASNQIINSLATGSIDFGQPNATTKNIKEIENYSQLSYEKYLTNGYGYVGINPRYVPDIEVRQAIMKAMNTGLTESGYYTGLAEVIYRPMSITSWAYPKDENGELVGEHEKVKYMSSEQEIKTLVESAGWKLGADNVYQKDGKRLELTFTIAGSTDDHPATQMFEDAAARLNDCGFDVDVTTSPNALKSLATGTLEVWAAAWSSTIDPDMYQVYHKDSTATSVKNWGYSQIFGDTTTQFNDEKEIINELSDLIEQGRKTINQDDRKKIYAQALDKVMELCVELPTYQRNDLIVYNSEVIDASTLNQDPSPTSGVTDRIWELNYVGAGEGFGGASGGLETGAIIGIVVGCIVVAGGAAAAFVILKRKNATREIIIEEEDEAAENVEESAEETTEETTENAESENS